MSVELPFWDSKLSKTGEWWLLMARDGPAHLRSWRDSMAKSWTCGFPRFCVLCGASITLGLCVLFHWIIFIVLILPSHLFSLVVFRILHYRHTSLRGTLLRRTA